MCAMSIESIVDKIGREELATRLGVGRTAISMSIKDGFFRPAWYKIIKRICKENRIKCHDEWFAWKKAPEVVE